MGRVSIFNEVEDDALVAESDVADIVVLADTRKKKKRVSIPEDLPREDIIHDLPNAEKSCSHDGTLLKRIGEDTSEQLELSRRR